MILTKIGKVIRKIQHWIKREKAWKRMEGKGSIAPTVTILFGLVAAIIVYINYTSKNPAAAKENTITVLCNDGNVISPFESQTDDFMIETTEPSVVTSFVNTTTTHHESTTLTTLTDVEITTSTEPEIIEESEEFEEEGTIYISDSDRILLTNLVAREYGSYWVDTCEKAKVVAVVMNRVNSPEFPNDIPGVIKQPGQFEGYLPVEGYDCRVTDDCIAAVDYYFENPWEFDSSIKYFEGDGTWNYFH